jgi:hypothetical protein
LAARNEDFLTEGKMWLDGAEAYGSEQSLVAKTGAAIYVKHTLAVGVLLADTY